MEHPYIEALKKKLTRREILRLAALGIFLAGVDQFLVADASQLAQQATVEVDPIGQHDRSLDPDTSRIDPADFPDKTKISKSKEWTPEYKVHPAEAVSFTFLAPEAGITMRDVKIEPIGLTPAGDLDVPKTDNNIGIFENNEGNAPQPGSGRGRVIVDGHTYTKHPERGAFSPDLPNKIQVGQKYSMLLADGTTVTYKITKVLINVPKNDYYKYIASEDLWGVTPEVRNGIESMVVTTCSELGTNRLIFIAQRVVS